MKKNLFLIIALILASSVIFSACRKKETAETEQQVPSPTPIESVEPTDEPSPTPEITEEPTATPTLTPTPTPTPSVKPSVQPKQPAKTSESDSAVIELAEHAQRKMDEQKAEIGGGIEIEVRARGNSVVHTYIYIDDFGDNETLKPIVEELTEASKADYEGDLEFLKANSVKSPSVIVEHLDKDRKMIYSREFK